MLQGMGLVVKRDGGGMGNDNFSKFEGDLAVEMLPSTQMGTFWRQKKAFNFFQMNNLKTYRF